MNIDILKTIENFYPKNINAYANEYELTPEFIFHKDFLKQTLNITLQKWNSFKNDISVHVNILDYSLLPRFISCYEANFSFKAADGKKYFVVYYVSVLYPAYSYLICDFETDKNHAFSESPEDISNFISEVNALIEKYFTGYKLMLWQDLKEVVPGYSLQLANPWKAKVFNFLFIEDPRFDKYL